MKKVLVQGEGYKKKNTKNKKKAKALEYLRVLSIAGSFDSCVFGRRLQRRKRGKWQIEELNFRPSPPRTLGNIQGSQEGKVEVRIFFQKLVTS